MQFVLTSQGEDALASAISTNTTVTRYKTAQYCTVDAGSWNGGYLN